MSLPHAYADSLTLDNMLGTEYPLPSTYASKELESIQPMGFILGADVPQIDFDLDSCTGKWTLWRDAYLSVPCTIRPTVGASVFADLPALAFKGSILSLISGVEAKAEGGSTVFKDEKSTVFTSNILAMLEKGDDWSITNCSSLQYAKDRTESDVVSGLFNEVNIMNPRTMRYRAVPSIATVGPVVAGDNGDSDLYNKGFAERRAQLIGNSVSSANVFPTTFNTDVGFTCTLNVPLRYISSFFEAFDFPIINSRFTFSFFMNTRGSNSGYSPLCRGTNLVGNVENAPSVVISGVPRLFYHRVFFNPLEAEMVATLMAQGGKGFSKLLKFTQTDMVKQPVSADSGPFSYQISTNCYNPKRVFAMVYPQNRVMTDAWPSPAVTGAYGFSTLNIQVNNTPYFSIAQNTLEAQWTALKETMALGSHQDALSQLNYADWLRTYRIHCLDISRGGVIKVNRNESVSLTIDAQIANAGVAVDVIYLIQRERHVTLNFGARALEVIETRS